MKRREEKKMERGINEVSLDFVKGTKYHIVS